MIVRIRFTAFGLTDVVEAPARFTSVGDLDLHRTVGVAAKVWARQYARRVNTLRPEADDTTGNLLDDNSKVIGTWSTKLADVLTLV